MGKRKEKEKSKEKDIALSSERKKQKKHKKHKKKKEKSLHSDNEEIDVVNDDLLKDDGTKGLKLKIKFGGKTLSTTELSVSDSGKEDVTTDDPDGPQVVENDDRNSKRGVKRSRDDEEKWLEALEKGELDDTGGLKKQKDTSIMTARQRALHGDKDSETNDLMQLPMYPEKNEEETEEEERRKQLRAKKRRQQLQKQVEDSKSQTIEKLLKGQKSKKQLAKNQNQNVLSGPHIRYQNNQTRITLSYSEELEFPIEKQTSDRAPDPIKCSVDGCHNNKKYNCSQSNLPICSLQCYKIVNTSQASVVVS